MFDKFRTRRNQPAGVGPQNWSSSTSRNDSRTVATSLRRALKKLFMRSLPLITTREAQRKSGSKGNARERHGLFRRGAFVAARLRCPFDPQMLGTPRTFGTPTLNLFTEFPPKLWLSETVGRL